MRIIDKKFRPNAYKVRYDFPTTEDYELYFTMVDAFDHQFVFKMEPDLKLKYEKWVRKNKLKNLVD